MELQEAYKQKLAAQLKEWNAEIALLEAKVSHAGADIKVKYAQEFADLHAKRHAASEKMKELEKASGAAWAQVRVTADKVWEDLKNGMAAARARFK